MITAAAGILLALASPTLAATRTHHGFDAYASDRSGAYNYGPINGQSYGQANGGYDRTVVQPQYAPGQNLPYPDRPYGDPDNW